jgi:hypothetical protein
MQLDRRRLGLGEAIDADDHPLAGLDLLRVAKRGVLDLALDEALLHGRDRAAQLVDALDQLLAARLELVGERLDEVRAAERVGGVGDAGLIREDLLGPERDSRGALSGQRERFVQRVGVQRLRATADRGQRLDRHAYNVVLRLLRSERRASGLRVEAERQRLRAGGAEPLAHDARPQPARRAVLRDLLEEVVVRVEEERQALAELVRRLPGRDCRLGVGDAVRERERELLHGGRAGLADVVAGDGDRVPLRQSFGAVREQVGRQPHRGPGREDVVPARDVLLEDVVLHRAAEAVAGHALRLGDQLVEQQQKRRRRVDRHRRRHLAERDAVQQELHVGERVDRHAGTSDFPGRTRVVRVVAQLRREVEGDREAGLAALQEVPEARVRLLGGREARVLPDRPRPAAVHRAIGAAREWILARRLALARRVGSRVDGLYLDPGVGLAPLLGRRHPGQPRRRTVRGCA